MVTSKRLLQVAKRNIDKWKKLLHLDPIWKIRIDIQDEQEMQTSLASVDIFASEYYIASIEFSSFLLSLELDELDRVINEIVCHELLHLVMTDFLRTAQMAAGKNAAIMDDLKYKFEQFTTRLQKSFLEYERHMQFEQSKLHAIIYHLHKEKKDS